MTGKRVKKGPSRLSTLACRLGEIPHLFAKVTVIYCVIAATGASWYSLRIMSRTGNDPAALLGVILGFFGGELLLLCLKTVLKKEETTDDETDEVKKAAKFDDTGI